MAAVSAIVQGAYRGNISQEGETMTTESPRIDSLSPDKRAISAIEARQGVISGKVVLVLIISTLFAIVALCATYYFAGH